MSEITLMLEAIKRGEKQASEQLLPLVYDKLRNLAAAWVGKFPAGPLRTMAMENLLA
jgi:hypothetical protein